MHKSVNNYHLKVLYTYWDKRVGIYILGKYALFLAGVSRMSKMLFPSIQFIITGLQFQMSINTQSTNTQIQFVTKCQKDQTYALFLNSWCFQDVRNCVPKCLIQKYRNKDTQIQLYTIHIPQPCAWRAHGHTPMYNFNWRICIPQKLADFIHYKYIYFKIIPPILRSKGCTETLQLTCVPQVFGRIYPISIYIFNLQIFSHCFQHISNANVNVNSPTLHQRSHRNPSTDIYPPSFGRIYPISISILKLQIFTNYWQHISNTNVYITKFLFPRAWRAHRNLSTDICPPSVSRIYPISIYIDIGYILDIYECWTYKYSQIVGSIFNTNVYFPQQGAWRAHRNSSTDIYPPTVGRIYPYTISIYIFNLLMFLHIYICFSLSAYFSCFTCGHLGI